MKAYPVAIKKEAIELLRHGLSHQEIADRLHVSRTTITGWTKQVPEGVLQDANRPKPGRPKKLSTQDAENLKLMILRGKASSASAATREFNKENVDPVSPNTVRRALQDVGGKAKKVVKKPMLLKRHMEARLQFAKKYENWTEDDWSLVVWTDESKINRFQSDGMKYTWIFNEHDQNHSDKHVIPASRVVGTIKHGGGSIMVWGCMTWHGPGYLVRIYGGLDAQLYVKILKDDLAKSVKDYNMDPNRFVFQQDNDSKHTSKLAMTYLSEMGITVESGRYLGPWPAQSPDLNPIEHLWRYVKRRLGEYPEPPKGMEELWKRISYEWYRIPKEVCQEFIRSMPTRIQAVIKAKGKHTTY